MLISLNNKVNSWQLWGTAFFVGLYILAIGVFLLQNKISPLFVNVQVVGIILGAICYLLSHLFRATRLQIAISLDHFATSEALFVQIISSGIGNVIAGWMKEPCIVGIFALHYPHQMPRIVVAVLYTRLFDFLVISCVLLLVSDPTTQPFLLVLLALLLLTFSFLVFLPQLCKRTISHLLKYDHTRRGVLLVRIIASIRIIYLEMKLHQLEGSFLIFILTLLVWFTEFVAIFVTMSAFSKENSSIAKAISIVITNLTASIPMLPLTSIAFSKAYVPLYLALLISGLLLSVWKSVQLYYLAGIQQPYS
ncbi:hypothetical protein TI05_01895 [Achromatium sp. WMS3]|nr:hypothetical protein TI05_01895 [Achromatium sp. WMS3]